MAEKNTFIIIAGILVLLAVVVLVVKPDLLFVVTGNENIGRIPSVSETTAGSTITVTYKAITLSGKWGASIIDTFNCPGFATQTKNFVMTSTDGETMTQNYVVPNKGGIECTFIGNFKFGDKAIKYFPNNIVKIKSTCISRNDLGIEINKWVAGTTTRDSLGTAIQSWSECE